MESERVLTWPLSTGLNLGWQATPFQKGTLQYQLRFDAYIRDRTTASTFQPPRSTLTNGIGAAWEYRRGGYNFLVNADVVCPEPMGRVGQYAICRRRGAARTPTAAEARTYAKYSVSASKDVFIGPFQKFHVNGAWFGGRDLDRFVKYQFGMFDDTRIHGVPASGVRFGELAMARGSYSLNVFEQVPAGSVRRTRVGARGLFRSGLAGHSRCGRRRELPRAMEYDPAGGCREELAARALPRSRIDDAAGVVAEATTMMNVSRRSIGWTRRFPVGRATLA